MRVEKSQRNGKWIFVNPFGGRKSYPTKQKAMHAARNFKPYSSQLFKYGELVKGESFEAVRKNQRYTLVLAGCVKHSLLWRYPGNNRLYTSEQFAKDVLGISKLEARNIRRTKTGLTLEATKNEFLSREECNLYVDSEEAEKTVQAPSQQPDLFVVESNTVTVQSVADKFVRDQKNLAEALVQGLTSHSFYGMLEEHDKMELLQSSVLGVQEQILNTISKVKNSSL